MNPPNGAPPMPRIYDVFFGDNPRLCARVGVESGRTVPKPHRESRVPTPNQIRGKSVAHYTNGIVFVHDGRTNGLYAPRIIFEDGSELRFTLRESDGDPYVEPIFI